LVFIDPDAGRQPHLEADMLPALDGLDLTRKFQPRQGHRPLFNRPPHGRETVLPHRIHVAHDPPLARPHVVLSDIGRGRGHRQQVSPAVLHHRGLPPLLALGRHAHLLADARPSGMDHGTAPLRLVPVISEVDTGAGLGAARARATRRATRRTATLAGAPGSLTTQGTCRDAARRTAGSSGSAPPKAAWTPRNRTAAASSRRNTRRASVPSARLTTRYRPAAGLARLDTLSTAYAPVMAAGSGAATSRMPEAASSQGLTSRTSPAGRSTTTGVGLAVPGGSASSRQSRSGSAPPLPAAGAAAYRIPAGPACTTGSASRRCRAIPEEPPAVSPAGPRPQRASTPAWGSASTSRTRLPRSCRATARLTARVVRPAPAPPAVTSTLGRTAAPDRDRRRARSMRSSEEAWCSPSQRFTAGPPPGRPAGRP